MQKKTLLFSVFLASFLAFLPVMPGKALTLDEAGKGGSTPPSFTFNLSSRIIPQEPNNKQYNEIIDENSPSSQNAGTVLVSSITQSTDTSTITFGISVACNNGLSHTNNSYYRRFDLDGDHGLSAVFSVGNVDIGIERATGNAGSQPLEVRLYSIANGDPLVLANLNLIGSASFSQPDANLTVQNFPVTGIVDPLTDDLVVELFTPDGQAVGNLFFIGSNSLGQSAPSYIAAADCGVSEPIDLATLGFPDMHIVMIVNSGSPVYTLDVTLAGKGQGTVTSSPAGIDCGTDCSEAYIDGTVVTLTATPGPGSKFKGWSGDADCGDGFLAMTGNAACTATFTRFPWPMFLPATTE